MITDLDEPTMRRLEREALCRCRANLVMSWGGYWGYNQHVLRCIKDPNHQGWTAKATNTRTLMGPDGVRQEVNVTTQQIVPVQDRELVKWDTDHGPMEMSIQNVRDMVCSGATAVEAYIFLRLCVHQNLNPFLKEVYLIKYEANKPASIVIGKDTYTQRAERHPDFLGMSAGLMVTRDNELVYTKGAFRMGSDVLLGAWSKIRRRGRDDTELEVMLKNYDKEQALWRTHKEDMIRKVVLVQGLREAFPKTFAGMTGGAIQDDTGDLAFQVDPDADLETVGQVVEGEGRIIEETPEPEREPVTVGQGESTEQLWMRIYPAVKDRAMKLGLGLVGIPRALDGLKPADFLKDHSEADVMIKLEAYALLIGAKPPEEAKEPPQPSEEEELFSEE